MSAVKRTLTSLTKRAGAPDESSVRLAPVAPVSGVPTGRLRISYAPPVEIVYALKAKPGSPATTAVYWPEGATRLQTPGGTVTVSSDTEVQIVPRNPDSLLSVCTVSEGINKVIRRALHLSPRVAHNLVITRQPSRGETARAGRLVLARRGKGQTWVDVLGFDPQATTFAVFDVVQEKVEWSPDTEGDPAAAKALAALATSGRASQFPDLGTGAGPLAASTTADRLAFIVPLQFIGCGSFDPAVSSAAFIAVYTGVLEQQWTWGYGTEFPVTWSGGELPRSALPVGGPEFLLSFAAREFAAKHGGFPQLSHAWLHNLARRRLYLARAAFELGDGPARLKTLARLVNDYDAEFKALSPAAAWLAQALLPYISIAAIVAVDGRPSIGQYMVYEAAFARTLFVVHTANNQAAQYQYLLQAWEFLQAGSPPLEDHDYGKDPSFGQWAMVQARALYTDDPAELIETFATIMGYAESQVALRRQTGETGPADQFREVLGRTLVALLQSRE